jgi:HK97 family phage major capsid protein
MQIDQEIKQEFRELLDEHVGVRLGQFKSEMERLINQRTSRGPMGIAPGAGEGELAGRRLPGRRTVSNLSDNEAFRSWLAAPRSYRSGIAFDLELKAAAPISGISPTVYMPQVYGPPQPALRLPDLIPSIQVTMGGAVEWTKETGFTPGADLVPETTLKPTTALTFANQNTPFVTIATISKASLQSLSDIPALTAWVNNRLNYAVTLKEEGYLLNDPTAGLLANATPLDPVYDPGATGTTTLDYVGAAISQLEALGYKPDGVVLSGADAAKARLLKTTLGSYLWSSPDSLLSTSGMWGVPAIISPSMPAGKFLAADFANSCLLFDRWQLRIDISYENEDDFVKNLACFRAELRVALAIPAPSGLVTGTLPAGLAATASHSLPSGHTATKR